MAANGLAFVQGTDDITFAVQVQKAMARAVTLVVKERSHHSFCIRTPAMIADYKLVWSLAWANKIKGYAHDEQIKFKKVLDFIELNEAIAQDDINSGYESAKRRSVILLSDLL